jgi:hypothetical protein
VDDELGRYLLSALKPGHVPTCHVEYTPQLSAQVPRNVHIATPGHCVHFPSLPTADLRRHTWRIAGPNSSRPAVEPSAGPFPVSQVRNSLISGGLPPHAHGPSHYFGTPLKGPVHDSPITT